MRGADIICFVGIILIISGILKLFFGDMWACFCFVTLGSTFKADQVVCSEKDKVRAVGIVNFKCCWSFVKLWRREIFRKCYKVMRQYFSKIINILATFYNFVMVVLKSIGKVLIHVVVHMFEKWQNQNFLFNFLQNCNIVILLIIIRFKNNKIHSEDHEESYYHNIVYSCQIYNTNCFFVFNRGKGSNKLILFVLMSSGMSFGSLILNFICA